MSKIGAVFSCPPQNTLVQCSVREGEKAMTIPRPSPIRNSASTWPDPAFFASPQTRVLTPKNRLSSSYVEPHCHIINTHLTRPVPGTPLPHTTSPCIVSINYCILFFPSGLGSRIRRCFDSNRRCRWARCNPDRPGRWLPHQTQPRNEVL